jgi:hypothetical protein
VENKYYTELSICLSQYVVHNGSISIYGAQQSGKSTLLIYCALWRIFTPNTKIVLLCFNDDVAKAFYIAFMEHLVRLKLRELGISNANWTITINSIRSSIMIIPMSVLVHGKIECDYLMVDDYDWYITHSDDYLENILENIPTSILHDMLDAMPLSNIILVYLKREGRSIADIPFRVAITQKYLESTRPRIVKIGERMLAFDDMMNDNVKKNITKVIQPRGVE